MQRKRSQDFEGMFHHRKIWYPAVALILLLLPFQAAHAIPLNELCTGESYQTDNLLMSNWDLVNAENVNINNIDIGAGYGTPDQFGIWSFNRELRADGWTSLSLSFDYLVSETSADITGVAGALAFRRVVGPTALIQGSIAVGTGKGLDDLGATTDLFRLGQDPGTIWIPIPEGLTEFWVRNTLTLSSDYGDNSAESGYLPGYGLGPAFINSFETHAPAPVPEPSTLLLLGSGLIGLAGRRFRKRRD